MRTPTTPHDPIERDSARRGRFVGPVATATALLLLFAGCSRDAGSNNGAGGGPAGGGTTTTAPAPGITLKEMDDEGPPIDGGKLVFGLEAETDGGFNVVTGRFAASGHYVGSAVYDPLATLDDKGQPVPYLADAFEHNADFTVWDITLKSGVTFHDGTAFSADDVKRNLDAHLASIITGKAVSGIDSVSVTDKTHVKVTTKKPWSLFPYVLTTQVGYMMAKAMFDDPTLASKPIGTGPFVFKDWQPTVSFKAVKNEHYWQAGKPHLSEIEFRPIPNAQKRADALTANEIDAMHTITGRDIQTLRDRAGIKMVEVETGEEVCIAMNGAKAPFDKLNARLAMAYATDVPRFLKETGRDVASPARGPFAPGQLGYREDAGYPSFDLEKAKGYVQAYEKETGQKLTFQYQGAANTDDAAGQQLLKSMWEAAGMQVELVGTPQVAQIVNAVLGTYQAIDWRNYGQPDPSGEYVWWHSSSIAPDGGISLNVARFNSPAIDKALDDDRTTVDPKRRDEDFATIAAELNKGVPYLWLERAHWTIAASPKVNGFLPAKNGSIQTLGAKTWIADLWLSH